MFGSTCSCLLALSFVILPPGTLHGQSDPAGPTRDSAFPFASDRRVLDPVRPWPRPVPPGTSGLPELARAAGMVFSGTVTAVTHRPATGGQAIETVAITFHVENAIRGATPGEDLTVTQWIGLWSGGQRYRIGERALLFLYPPSKLGLTSCVGGPIGRFSLDPLGRVLLSAQQLSAFRRDPILGGRSRVSFRDFALAVRQASGEE
jgi:hypothetical protein